MTNKDILSEIDKIKVNMMELGEKITDLEKKAKEEKKSKVWKPEEGDQVWVIYGSGRIEQVTYDNSDSSSDHDYYEMGMLFQTKQQAKRKKFEMQLEKKLKDFALENNEAEIDWDNEDKIKWKIFYDYNNKQLSISSNSYYKDYGQIYFTSIEVVEKAIETFRDELIRYFTKED